MRMNAVLGKELTTRMRGRRAALIVTGYITLLAAVSLIVLTSSAAPRSYDDSAALGQNLFIGLASLQMTLIVFITPASTADAISGERQRQTLDLLLVTRLSSLAIVLGKLLAGLAFDLLLILCSLPLFSLVFLFGGVSPMQLISMFVTFLVVTVMLGSLALFISTVTRRSGSAIILSLLGMLILTVGIGLVSIFLVPDVSATTAGTVSLPLLAYLDPIVGFIAALPGADWLTGAGHITAGPLNLSIWQDQIIVDVILSIIFIATSVRLVRPHWTPQ